jgi:hypothetical protein
MRGKIMRAIALAGAAALLLGALTSVADAASSAPKNGSKWSGRVKGQQYESGTITFAVVKHGGKLYAKGKATLHTACFAVEQSQTLKAGPTRVLRFRGLIAGHGFVAKQGTSEDLLHWEIHGSFARKRVEIRYAEETEGPPRSSCGFNVAASGPVKTKG